MADEKFDEKEREKQEEKSRDEKSSEEKSWEEKYRRDPLGTIVWALIFIWAGLVFLADNLGFLDNLRSIDLPGIRVVGGFEVWSVILIGAGVIVMLEVLVRLLVPEYRRPLGGSIFFAILLIGLGLGNFIGWNNVWAVVLIALGLSIIARSFLGERRS